MRGSGKRVGLAVLAVIALICWGCSGEVHSSLTPNNEAIEPTDFGNGIYYFHVTGSTFGSSLSAFIAKNDSLVLIGTDSEDGDKDRLTVGHWAYFKKKDE